MRTEQLIADLAASGTPVGNPRLRIGMAIIGGWIAALAGLLLFLGPPLQELGHTGGASLAVKVGYTLALALLGAMAAIAAGRPGRRLTGPVALLMLPAAVLSVVAVLELSLADASLRAGMAMGTTYWDCVLSVALASLPVLAGATWAYRIMAPTRLRLAGFLVGLSAGAAGALAFSLYCHEASAAFLLAAYTPAMLIPALLGAAMARPLLKW
jgi:hypothetical protein